MSVASVAAQQSSSQTATTGTAAAPSSSSTSANALASLSGNFQNFLQMLMTQLKNQDPTSPMDTNTFTTELVQFSSVEQQINTNANLTQLIQLTQGDTVVQSASLLGKQVVVQSTSLPLQNGAGAVQFTGTAGQKVAINVSDSSGTVQKSVQLTATQGSNSWTWDGTSNAGNKLADGSYTVSVNDVSSGGSGTALTFGVVGTATSVQVVNNVVQLQLGPVTVPFSAVQSVGP
jgi:flagellar basal-body rod modification protein FlgD